MPENWFRLAWQIYEAASVLQMTFMESAPYDSEAGNHRLVGSAKGATLLLGLACENAIKGALVYKNPPDISDGRLKPKHIHKEANNFLPAAQKLELSLTEAQAEMLQRLTHFLR